MPVYVKLFHGRPDPNADLQDWGEQGPVFGPLDWFHVTYHDHIRMGDSQNDDQELKLVGDMLYYDGMYYGDWSAFGEEHLNDYLRGHRQIYDPAKAVPPASPKSDSIVLKLTRNDAGQVLDGIRARKESWERTLRYMQDGQSSDDLVEMATVEECKDEHEAERMVKTYSDLVDSLEAQL